MRKNLHITLPILAAIALAGCGQSPDERFDRASQSFHSHRYTDALGQLKAVIKVQPRNPRALEMLARTYLEMREPVSARAMLDRLGALDKLPEDADLLYAEADLMEGRFEGALERVEEGRSAEAYRIRALAQIGLKNFDKAAQAFAAGLDGEGRKDRLQADYALFQLERGDIAEARRLADLAVQPKQASAGALVTRADVALTEGQTDQALQWFDKALQVYPESRAALLGKIGLLGDTGRIKAARPLIEDAARRSPDDVAFVYLKARLAAEEGDWSKVRGILQPLEIGLKNYPKADLLYAKSMLELGQAEQARVRLSSFLLRNPDDRQSRFLLGQAKLAVGDARGAFEVLRPLAARNDASGEVLALTARAASSAGIGEARDYAARAKDPVVRSVVSDFANADAAMKAESWPAAIAAYERIIKKTDGKNVIVLNNLAFAYSQSGDKDRALHLAEQALSLAPENPSVMDTMGWLLHETGKDRGRALALLRKASAKAPDNQAIAAHLRAAEKG